MRFVIISSLEDLFSPYTRTLPCQESTRAYICSVLKEANKKDLNTESLTLIYAKAKFEHKFELFQKLGDWILISKTIFPDHLNGASQEYYDALAQNSYYRCYKILEGKWKLYEELADSFPKIVESLRETMQSNHWY